MSRRAVFTTVPPRNDYVLSGTGLTWNIDRAHGDGSVSRISAGERNRASALGAVLSLAERDGTDAWDADGIRSYRLLRHHRPSP
jgi:hypothetical protein